MCKQANVIQKSWEPKEGDWCFAHDDVHLVCDGEEWQTLGEKQLLRPFCDYGNPAEDFDYYENNIKESIWLPQQDQLQEIYGEGMEYLSKSDNMFYKFLTDFSCWITTTGGPRVFYQLHYKNQFKCVEELWLAFTMYERYQKIWNGKEWISKGRFQL
jgi:hypothetical protein